MAAVLVASTLAAGGYVAAAHPRKKPTLTTTVNSPAPEQGMPVSLAFAGSAPPGANPVLYAVARPAGGVACQPSFAIDQGAAGSVSQSIADGVNVAAASDYSIPETWYPDASGSEIICAWLEQPSTTATAPPTVIATVTTMVAVGGPQATVVIGFPAAPIANQAFGVDFTTQTDQSLSLYSRIRKASTGPCDASVGADLSHFPDSIQVLPATAVDGGPTLTTGQATLGPGSYIVCAWVQGPASDEVDAGPVTYPFTIPVAPKTVKTNPMPAPKTSPEIFITSLTASVTQGITVQGTTAPLFTGKLTLKAACGTATVTGTAGASGGTFNADLALPTGCVAQSPLAVKVYYAGSATFLKAVLDDSTVVTAPVISTHTTTDAPRSLRTVFTEVRRSPKAVTNVFRTRPNRISVASSPRLILRLHWTRWNTRGGRGQGIAYTHDHHHYPIGVTAGHAFHGTFACLTITHRVSGHPRIRRLGLAREGLNLRWVGLRTLHRPRFTGKPWPAGHGCPAVSSTSS